MANENFLGASLTFGTSGTTAQITDLNIDGEERAVIDDTNYATTGYREYRFGSLVDTPEMEVEAQFEAGDLPPITAAAETITLTFPDAGSLTGTAAVIRRSFPLPMEDRSKVRFTVKYDGKTGPTWAAV